jgi:hypothetical protein
VNCFKVSKYNVGAVKERTKLANDFKVSPIPNFTSRAHPDTKRRIGQTDVANSGQIK